MNIKLAIDEYSDMVTGIATITAEKQTLIDSVLTPEIKAKIAEIEAEFAPKLDAVAARKAELETAIKQVVIAEGVTVKGDYHQFVYAKGRVSWDTKALDGYAAAHPEILQFKIVGDPSVSVRGMK
jgi:phage host-nuclease inhibitor protein Gam